MKKEMNTFASRINRTLTMTLGIGLLTALSAATASAGCGSYDPRQPMPHQSDSNAVSAQSAAESDGNPSHSWKSIVGLWKVTTTATDGSGFTDFGYSQWHSDGTELLNSGGRAPSTQNYCLGVWEKTGDRTYKLNHFALSYDAVTGVLNGKVNIRETLLLNERGNTYSGTFTIDIYDPTGAIIVAHIAGNTTGSRITIDTPTP